jgi:hypothetical protein
MRASLKTILLLAGALVLTACAGPSLLPRASNVSSTAFQTYEQVEGAFSDVVPGATRTPDLSRLGFDPALTPNVEILTYVTLSDRFLVDAGGSSRHVPQAVQDCIEAEAHCAAYVFHLQRLESRHVGNAILDLTGFATTVVNSGWTADVLLVVEDGTVVYKIMSGNPRIENARESHQPLGPFQNVGRSATGAPSSPRSQ